MQLWFRQRAVPSIVRLHHALALVGRNRGDVREKTGARGDRKVFELACAAYMQELLFKLLDLNHELVVGLDNATTSKNADN
jgi:hypothetical protein